MNLLGLQQMIRKIIVKRTDEQLITDEWIVNKVTRQFGQFWKQDGDIVTMIADGVVIECNRADVSHFKPTFGNTYCEVKNGVNVRLGMVLKSIKAFDEYAMDQHIVLLHNPHTRHFDKTIVYGNHNIHIYHATEQAND